MATSLLEMIGASWRSQAMRVAAELCISDLLASGPMRIDDLARATQCKRASLQRLMRALVSFGLCVEHEDAVFELTPTGSLLRSDAPFSVRAWAIWWGKYEWPVWGSLLHSVRTDQGARKLVTGREAYEYLKSDSEAASIFNRAMVDITRLVAREVVRVYDFSGLKRIVDVGGGYGELLVAILQSYSDVRGVLFDLPHVIEGARSRIEEMRLRDRCELIAGDFFASVPGGADAHLLKGVLHSWDDGRSAAILRNCGRELSPNGKLLIVERIMPARIEASIEHQAVIRADLNMLVGPGGRERTESEFRGLLDASGFETRRVLPTAMEFSIIEAIPARYSAYYR
jgi:SAM-dependent methyltransferase